MPRLPQKPSGPSAAQPMVIKEPYVIMFKGPNGELVTNIHPDKALSHKSYGIMICDLVRHVARAYKVSEDAVWEWVDKERANPTSDITNPS